MRRFHGRVGFAETVEVRPGIHQDVVTERRLYGDIVQNRRTLVQGENLNKDLSVGNSISVVMDAYTREHFHQLKYVEWQGVLWSVPDVTEEHPRLILQLGEVYNGPTPAGAPDAP